MTVALSAVLLGVPVLQVATFSTAHAAAGEPSVDDVKAAGEQFNLGRTAFKEQDYVVAAEHFERADALAPNEKVLDLAIQSRLRANHDDRAAMLAVLAQRRYPDNPRFSDLGDVIERAERNFARVDVSCAEPCGLVVGMRLIHGAPSRDWVLFLEDGTHPIRAGWDGERTVTKDYEATAGEVGELEFDVPKADFPTATDVDDGFAASTSDPFGSEGDSNAPGFADEPPKSEEKRSGLAPTWFWVGAGTTVALAGVSTWSGIDTLSSPGQSKVREVCRDESCEEYRDGVAKQNRTNLFWGITAGAGIVTGVLYFLTDWGSDEPEGEYGDQLSLQPWLGLGDGATLGAASVGASGRF